MQENQVSSVPTASPSDSKPAVIPVIPVPDTQPVTPIAAAEVKVEPAPSEESQEIAKRMAMIAKREKVLLDKESKWKQDAETTKQTYEQKIAELEKQASLVNRLKQKDYSALDEVEVDYNDYTQYKLNGGLLTQDQLAAKLTKQLTSQFNEALDKKEKQFAEAQAKSQKDAQALQYEQTKNYVRDQLDRTKKETPDKWAYLDGEPGVEDLILKTVETYYDETTQKDDEGNITKPGRRLSLEEAAQMVDEHFKQSYKKIFEIKPKIKDLWLELHPELKPVEKPVVNAKKDPAPTTITSKMTVAATPSDDGLTGLTGREYLKASKQRALEKLALLQKK